MNGLALGDFDLALRGLLGEDAPISASMVARLKEQWQADWRQWKRRSLGGLEVVYMWVDGVYVKAGLEKERAALLVAIGGLSDGRKVVLAVEPGYRESTDSWSEILRDLKQRGINCPCLVTCTRTTSTSTGRRKSWDMGRLEQCEPVQGEPGGSGAAMLEPQTGERHGQATQEGPGASQEGLIGHRLFGKSARSRGEA